jgi:bacterioferritin (cytochrome b1)
MKKLAQAHPEKLLDLLNERLKFERTGVKLYDMVLAKLNLCKDQTFTPMIGQIKTVREQEKEHEEWLEDCIRGLGGTAHEETELSELVERESKGVMDVVATDDEIPHLFHALLTAELVDNNGWKLLLTIADEADDDEARREFRKRAREEEEHLIFIRSVVAALTRRDVLGKNVQVPTSL